jgi:23S rRNA (cytidine1920-2'-O)/16S rRNA (cytidine1409-2'-O)-methyltransferase
LLQHGAESVVALDVGYGQLHEKLRTDDRVTVLEHTNIRDTTLETLGVAPFPLIVVDVSFISLRTVAPALCALAAPGADLIALIKPQFEAGRDVVSKGRGVVRDPEVWEQVIRDVVAAFGELNAARMDVMESPVTGAEGNVEFLGHFVVNAGGVA